MTNLVIVMAGDGSLHEHFTSGRAFELWVCYWGDDDAVAARFEESCDRFFRIKGQKWALVREIGKTAREQGLPPFSGYDYVFLPDDDIEFPNGAADITRAFELAGDIRADMFQPAITNESYSWEASRRLTDAVCHATTYAEIMMPAYSGAIFEECVLRILHLDGYLQVGWGLEPSVVRLAESWFDRPVRTFVLDDVPVVHARPLRTGTSAYDRGWAEAFLTPFFEGLLMREVARFASREAAANFEFQMSDNYVDWPRVEQHMQDVSAARRLLRASKKRTLRAAMLALVMRGSRNS